MKRKLKYKVIINLKQIKELEKIVNSPKAEQRMAQRAKIILMSADNIKNKDIASELGIAAKTVGKWQKRFNQEGIDGLKDSQRSGRPTELTTLQRAEIIAIACDFPKNYGNETHDTWTLDILTKTVNSEIEGLDTSCSSVYRTLKRNALHPNKVKPWLHSKDPEFREKANEIIDLYLNPPENCATICVDEKPAQALEHKNEMTLPQPGKAGKKEYEYKRNGTQTLIAGFNIENGHVTAACGKTRKGPDLVAFMEDVAKEYEKAEKIHIVWDNLNIHCDGPGKRWTEFNERHNNKFIFHYTPKHASWLNQVEVFFSILHRRVLKHGSFKSEKELKERMLKFISLWNRIEGHAFDWAFKGFPMQEIKKEA